LRNSGRPRSKKPFRKHSINNYRSDRSGIGAPRRGKAKIPFGCLAWIMKKESGSFWLISRCGPGVNPARHFGHNLDSIRSKSQIEATVRGVSLNLIVEESSGNARCISSDSDVVARDKRVGDTKDGQRPAVQPDAVIGSQCSYQH
jgi:hypothetical protein